MWYAQTKLLRVNYRLWVDVGMRLLPAAALQAAACAMMLPAIRDLLTVLVVLIVTLPIPALAYAVRFAPAEDRELLRNAVQWFRGGTSTGTGVDPAYQSRSE